MKSVRLWVLRLLDPKYGLSQEERDWPLERRISIDRHGVVRARPEWTAHKISQYLKRTTDMKTERQP